MKKVGRVEYIILREIYNLEVIKADDKVALIKIKNKLEGEK